VQQQGLVLVLLLALLQSLAQALRYFTLVVQGRLPALRP
jgi:hypothetical protein